MKNLSDIVIVSDMDGTLLNFQKKITPENLRAIEKFRSMGGKFTVATGRTIQSFEPYIKDLHIDMPVILYNGAMIYDYNSGKILCQIHLPEKSKEIAVEIMNSVENLGGEVLKSDSAYVFENNEYEDLHTKMCGVDVKFCRLENMSPQGWLKVLFASSPENIQKLVDFIAEKRYNEVSFVKSSDIFCEMLEPSSTKGSALKMYRQLDGMRNMKFISIGDYNNDIEMIQEADFGAVPSNAQPEVKKSAGIILKNSCDENAVAELIDLIIQKNIYGGSYGRKN